MSKWLAKFVQRDDKGVYQPVKDVVLDAVDETAARGEATKIARAERVKLVNVTPHKTKE